MAEQIGPSSCDFVPFDTQKQGLKYIAVSHLDKRFSDKPDSLGLVDLSFGIDQGKITAIIGESGSGKTTLLRLIYGLLKPDKGEIRFKGWKVPSPDEKLIPGHSDMRMVSQHFDDLNTYANVWDNVASRLSNTDLQEKHDKTEVVLKSLNILQLAKQRVADLSGGEKQRVAIARALITGPEVLLMDEPFNQVDASFRDHLQHDIRNIVENTGLTVLMVSHDPTEVLALADEVLVLKAGKLMANGKTVDIYHQPPNSYSATLLAKSNCLGGKDALLLGAVWKNKAVIHPEWISLFDDAEGEFQVSEILFKGFFEEITVQKGPLFLRVTNKQPGKFSKGQRVRAIADHFVEVED